MSNVFDEMVMDDEACIKAAEKLDQDMAEAVKLCMQRREGRIFLQWLMEGQDPRAVMRRVMHCVEELYG